MMESWCTDDGLDDDDAAVNNLEQQYANRMQKLRTQLVAKVVPTTCPSSGKDASKCEHFLSSDALDDQLVEYVVLFEATPCGLAEFARQQKDNGGAALIGELLSDKDLMKRMLLADGAAVTSSVPKNQSGKKKNSKDGQAAAAQYGRAMQIYKEIQNESPRAASDGSGVLSRLALAVCLEHAVPIRQSNPKDVDDDCNVDPVRRYLNYEAAYLHGELDPAFDQLSTWELRMVVNGDEPDEVAAWGRATLRNFRPDHILDATQVWRYVSLVRSDVRYGSQNVQHDRPELQKYQNILMNGGVCGRRAFIGRFILRAFGIPTEARPSKGHGALCHWTSDQGWVVNLGGGWGAGWTKTRYGKDKDFLATTQARQDTESYWKVKRAQWIGDVVGEKRVYGEQDGGGCGFWYDLSLRTQRAIINSLRNKKITKRCSKEPDTVKRTMAEIVLSTCAAPSAKQIAYNNDGSIVIPAAAYLNPKKTRDIHVMTSFRGGSQIYLPSFAPQGKTMMRGGTWKNDANSCCSGHRLLSDGYGKYHNWGFRACVSPPPTDDMDGDVQGTYNSELLSLDLAGDITMELVYIKPGTFIMGGENEQDGRFKCVDVPKHKVELTHGYYLGKQPVTQAQYQAVMGKNPSKSTKAPDCPVDNIGEDDAMHFCSKVGEMTGMDVRLPTDAEWEYACRAGRGDDKWFFGNDPSQLGEYAWFKDNAGGKSHPVGQKKPNPWGLYDVYGNVCERVADKYSKDYYAKSPLVDPTGPSQGTKSRFEYKVNVPRSGEYTLVASAVTVNYNQRLNVSVNTCVAVIQMPFTLGEWQDSPAVTLHLEQGDNKLHFWRDKPPQYGLVIKDFTLKPV